MPSAMILATIKILNNNLMEKIDEKQFYNSAMECRRGFFIPAKTALAFVKYI